MEKRLVTVYLYGWMRDRFGEKLTLSLLNPIEAFVALDQLFKSKGGIQDIAVNAESYAVILGDLETGEAQTEKMLFLDFPELPEGQTHELHIIPQIKGENGIVSTIIGVVLLAAVGVLTLGAGFGLAAVASIGIVGVGAVSLTLGQIALLGAVLTLGGIANLLSSVPDRPPDYHSFLYSGPINNYQEGGAVPVVLGRLIVGVNVISGRITNTRLSNMVDSSGDFNSYSGYA